MRKTKMDDGFYPYLVEGAALIGAPGIPMLMDLRNTEIPKKLIPFEKILRTNDKRGYVHFYMHDKYFEQILTSTSKYVDLLKQFDGVITPDCTLERGQAPCLQQTNTYFNRAVGYYLQKQGIPVIPNIRWSDTKSFEYCFLGVPKNSIVCISTHGCIKSNREKAFFKIGLREMMLELNPTSILVHGPMPSGVFAEYLDDPRFHRYPSMLEQVHASRGGDV